MRHRRPANRNVRLQVGSFDALKHRYKLSLHNQESSREKIGPALVQQMLYRQRQCAHSKVRS